jgi:hypothetical protein
VLQGAPLWPAQRQRGKWPSSTWRGRQRTGSLLASGASFLRTATANVPFDRIQRCDALESLVSGRRGTGGGELIETPSHMRPAEREAHLALFSKGATASLAVDLKNALEARKMRDWPRHLALGRTAIDATAGGSDRPQGLSSRA